VCQTTLIPSASSPSALTLSASRPPRRAMLSAALSSPFLSHSTCVSFF
jgi:hypothetical protein